jgi:DNA gyrase subunit B
MSNTKQDTKTNTTDIFVETVESAVLTAESANTAAHVSDDTAYGAEQISILEGLEAVRKRPGMYIGNTSVAGLHHLVYEIVDNSIDEFLAGFGKKIEIILNLDGSCTVKDQGRGIPVEKHANGKSALEVVMTVLHAGGKFNNSVYKTSGGLHGVGASVVNALSSVCQVDVYKNGLHYRQIYNKGIPQGDTQQIGVAPIDPQGQVITGTHTTFLPDASIFTDTTQLSIDYLTGRMRELAFLNAGLVIALTDSAKEETKEFCFQGGIVSFVEYMNRTKTSLHPKPIFLKNMVDMVCGKHLFLCQ